MRQAVCLVANTLFCLASCTSVARFSANAPILGLTETILISFLYRALNYPSQLWFELTLLPQEAPLPPPKVLGRALGLTAHILNICVCYAAVPSKNGGGLDDVGEGWADMRDEMRFTDAVEESGFGFVSSSHGFAHKVYSPNLTNSISLALRCGSWGGYYGSSRLQMSSGSSLDSGPTPFTDAPQM